MTSDPTSEVIGGRSSKNRYFTHFEGRTSISTINQRLFEAIEAMEAIEVIEAAEDYKGRRGHRGDLGRTQEA